MASSLSFKFSFVWVMFQILFYYSVLIICVLLDESDWHLHQHNIVLLLKDYVINDKKSSCFAQKQIRFMLPLIGIIEVKEDIRSWKVI